MTGVRRRPGTLLPLEAAIIDAALGLRRAGDTHFHGFGIARVMAQGDDAGALTSGGSWSAPTHDFAARVGAALGGASTAVDDAVAEGRPRRRLYTVTGAAQVALAQHRQATRPAAPLGRAAWGTP